MGLLSPIFTKGQRRILAMSIIASVLNTGTALDFAIWLIPTHALPVYTGVGLSAVDPPGVTILFNG
jgi:hypothetical protein